LIELVKRKVKLFVKCTKIEISLAGWDAFCRSEKVGIFFPRCSREEDDVIDSVDKLQLDLALDEKAIEKPLGISELGRLDVLWAPREQSLRQSQVKNVVNATADPSPRFISQFGSITDDQVL